MELWFHVSLIIFNLCIFRSDFITPIRKYFDLFRLLLARRRQWRRFLISIFRWSRYPWCKPGNMSINSTTGWSLCLMNHRTCYYSMGRLMVVALLIVKFSFWFRQLLDRSGATPYGLALIWYGVVVTWCFITKRRSKQLFHLIEFITRFS